MFFSFSFRSPIDCAFENRAPGLEWEKPKPGWQNCTPLTPDRTVFVDCECSWYGHCPGCHQPDLIDTRRVPDVDHFSNLREAQLVVAFDEQNALRASGEDCSESRL